MRSYFFTSVTAPLFALFVFALQPAHGDLHWIGSANGGNGTALYQENNWSDDGDAAAPHSTPPASTINPNLAVNDDLFVVSGTAGGADGALSHLLLGNAGSLTVSGGILRMRLSDSAGIKADGSAGGARSTITLSATGALFSQVLQDQDVSIAGDASLTIYGTGNPLNNSVIDFASGWKGALTFLAETPGDVVSEHLGKFTVGGETAVAGVDPAAPEEGDNVVIITDGAAGAILTVISTVTTIDTVDRFAWGENIGWTNWRWDTGAPGEGATIGQYFCSGLVYGENVGWIKLGTGAPADGIDYANTDAGDFGVNHDGMGNLSGLAWGENIGWIKFDQSVTDPPRVDFATGKISGYAWSENCGWIDLGSNGTHFVKTETIDAGPDTDGDMLADAWELEQAMLAGLGAVLTHLDKNTDSDGDGESDFFEYLADSDPFDPGDTLRIVTIGLDHALADITLEWTSSPRRIYDLGSSTDFDPFAIAVPDLAPDPGATTSVVLDKTPPLVPREFWRVGAKLPLTP